MVRFLPFLISLVLTVYALFSCIQTPDEDVPHLPKLLWIVLIVFVPFAGPIVWLLMARAYRNRRESAVRRSPSQPAPRPTAPDDDPDFLKSLDRFRDPRTTVKPSEPDEPVDQPQPKDAKQPTDAENPKDSGNPKDSKQPEESKQPKESKKPEDIKGPEESPSEAEDGKA